jgi:Winged helix-turn helix
MKACEECLSLGRSCFPGSTCQFHAPSPFHAQEKVIRRWLADKPTEHGFPTDLWTGPRAAHMIRQEFGAEINPKYMTVWLRRRGFTPQKPRRVPRERDPEAIAAWFAADWPRIKKSPAARCPHRPDR